MCEDVKFIEDNEDIQFVVPVDTPEGGTTDYNDLFNKPQINDVQLVGNKTSKQLKLQDEMASLTNLEIEKLLGDD